MEHGAGSIDELDRSLVERLRQDGRETNRSLARALGVNEATVASRLRRLEETRAVHVVALTDMEGFGKQFFAFALISVDDRSPAEVGIELADVPEVISITVTTGRCDLFAGVLARDRAELGRIIGEVIPRIDGIAAVRCEVAVDVLRFDSEWATLRTGAALDTVARPPLEAAGVDGLDLAIVAELQRDARSSNRRIAAALDVSEGTIRQRVRRLEDDRLIRICAVSDIEAFGRGAAANVGITLRGGAVQEVGAALAALDGVAVVVRSLGEFDFVVVVLADTRAHLLATILDSIRSIDGVRATETLEVAGMLKHVYTWVRLVTPQ
ncbi:Lrp/AsnC family transcriptional regulator [Paraconexibacter sp.]|uniref:Lrp/AsnC family transcriptional regulator n=1 Tax=Paraconexibacter sp. TaxID=2949640 RepID=UPI003562823A